MNKYKLHTIKLLCDGTHHCGDYGEFYWDTQDEKLIIVLGDADADNGLIAINMYCADHNITIERRNEEYPEGDQYMLISRGIEVYPDMKSWNIETGDYDRNLYCPHNISVENYLDYTRYLERLPE